MKNAILPLVIILFCSQSRSIAADITDLVGFWKGTRTEIYRGERISVSQTTRFRPYQQLGIKGSSSIYVPGAGVITASGIYHPSGKYEATAIFRGQVLSVSTGRWKFSKNTLSVRGTTRDTTGSYTARVSFRLIGKKRFAFVSTLSNGARITGTFRR